jgi:TolB protein
MKPHLFLLLAVACSTRAASAGELAGNRFLITSVRTGDTEIFEVDPDTADARNVTRSPASEDRYPCWSPDGRRIAFTSNRAQGTYNLFVCDADGSNVRQLTHETGTAVAYMPSWAGDRIVFGLHRVTPEMASINPDGSDLKLLGAGHDPCFSPDGKRVTYTGEAPGGVSVFVMDADGSNKRQVVKDVNPWGAVFPSWSPDGKQIVYSFKVGEALELFIVDAKGAAPPRQLTRLNKVCTPAAWSPDGKWISFRYTDEMYWRNKARMEQVYAHPQGDKRPVWVIRPDGADAHVIEALRYQCAMDGSRAAWKPAGPASPARADARYFNPRTRWVAR